MSRPFNFDGDPIIRMRAYVRKSTERAIKNRASEEGKTPGQIIDDLISRPYNQTGKKKIDPTRYDEDGNELI